MSQSPNSWNTAPLGDGGIPGPPAITRASLVWGALARLGTKRKRCASDSKMPTELTG